MRNGIVGNDFIHIKYSLASWCTPNKVPVPKIPSTKEINLATEMTLGYKNQSRRRL